MIMDMVNVRTDTSVMAAAVPRIALDDFDAVGSMTSNATSKPIVGSIPPTCSNTGCVFEKSMPILATATDAPRISVAVSTLPTAPDVSESPAPLRGATASNNVTVAHADTRDMLKV
jgi:hypothetical protein